MTMFYSALIGIIVGLLILGVMVFIYAMLSRVTRDTTSVPQGDVRQPFRHDPNESLRKMPDNLRESINRRSDDLRESLRRRSNAPDTETT